MSSQNLAGAARRLLRAVTGAARSRPPLDPHQPGEPDRPVDPHQPGEPGRPLDPHQPGEPG
jgi:hypothetical protein